MRCLLSFLLLSLSTPLHAANLVRGGEPSSTGENTLELPLPLPPGVGGVEPSLSLTYGHRGGMGPLGFGWSLTTSVIALDRSTPDPLNAPTWRLDGVELVPDGGVLRPRVDDGRTIVPTNGPSGQGFVVYDREGWTAEYGLKGGVVASCSMGPCRTVEASLTRVIDPHGLAVVYRYDALGSPGQQHLVSVRWTLDAATGTAVGPTREAKLRYRALPEPWMDRRAVIREVAHVLDAIDVRVDGERVRTIDLDYRATADGGVVLRRVDEIGRGDAGPTRRLADFDYAPDGLNWSGWSASPLPFECGDAVQIAGDGRVIADRFDLSGDGISDLVRVDGGTLGLCTSDLPDDAPQDPANGWLTATSQHGLTDLDALRQYRPNGVDSELIDLDGDGHVDRVRRACQKGWSPGDPCQDMLLWQPRIGWLRWGPEQDVTPPGADVSPELARPFDASLGERVGLTDLTGDGLPDWVQADVKAAEWLVWRNVGGGFAPGPERWPAPMPDLSWTPAIYGPLATSDTHDARRGLLDLTGDGLLDAVVAEGDCAVPADRFCRWTVHPGTGYGFDAPFDVDVPFPRAPGQDDVFPLSRVHPPMCATYAGDPEWSPCRWPDPEDDLRGVHVTDLDGDGLGDLVWGDEVAFNVAGRRFAEPVAGGLPSEGPWGSGPIHSHAADEVDGRYQDHDGDGFVDWIGPGAWQAGAAPAGRRLPPHVLTSVVRPTGGETSFDYAPAIGFAAQTAHRLPGESEPVGPLWVLSSVVHSEPDVGDRSFAYTGPVAAERGLLGFAEVVTTAADGSRTQTSYHVDPAEPDLAGRAWRVQDFAPDGSLLAVSTTDWEVAPLPDGRVRVRSTGGSEALIGSSGEATVRSTERDHDAVGRPEQLRRYDHDGALLTETTLGYVAVPHPRAPGLEVDQITGVEVWGPTQRLESVAFDRDPTTGDLLEQRRLLQPEQAYHAETWKPDPFGYPLEHVDVGGTRTVLQWSSDYLHVESSLIVGWPGGAALPPGWSQPPDVEHVQAVDIDPITGEPRRVEERNGAFLVRATERSFDPFGRLSSVRSLSPDRSTWLQEIEVAHAPDGSWSQWSRPRYDEASTLVGVALSRTIHDAFGRPVQRRTRADDAGSFSVTWLKRDEVGRVVRASLPLLEPGVQPTPWGAPTATEVAFDDDGRTVTRWTSGLPADEPDDRTIERWEVPAPGEAVVSTWTRHSATVDAVQEAWIDGAGRLDRLVDALGNETSYGYDEAGRRTEIRDAAGHRTFVGYDSWGRRTMLADPDLSQCRGAGPYDPRDCPITFEWNLDGTLASRTDAAGRTLRWGYDARGRTAWATGGCEAAPGLPCAQPGEGTSWFFHDGAGQEPGHGPWELGGLTAMVDPSGRTDVLRDAWGRQGTEIRTIAGQRFETVESLDSWGLVQRSSVSAGGVLFEPVDHEYDAVGRLVSVVGAQSGVEWVGAVSFDPWDGALAGFSSLGGALATSFEYGDDRRLRRVLGTAPLPGPTGAIVDLDIDYDPAGRVASKTGFAPDVAAESFGYDLLGRLTSAGGPTAGYEHSYAYDAIGNLTWNSSWLDRGDATYAYSDREGPHAVRGIGLHSGFDYDVTGAITARWQVGEDAWDRSYEYGADGRLRATVHTEADTGTETRTTGLLDGFKQRVARTVEIDGAPTSSLVRPNARIELRDGVPVRTILAGGRRIAETTAAVVGPTDTATFFWEDHQGQQVAALQVGGLLSGSPTPLGASQVRRDPWGGLLDGDEALLSRSASGGEREPTGETYLGWRLYDADVGRFLQADTLASATAGMGQGLNRYRYGWNSPTNFTDPSGHWEVGLAPPSMGRMAGSVGMASVTGPMGDGGLGAALGRGFADGVAKKKPTREELDRYRWGKDIERTCTGAMKNHPWCKERYGRSGGRGGGGGGRRCADGDSCGGEDPGGIGDRGDFVDDFLSELRHLLDNELRDYVRSPTLRMALGQLDELVRAGELGRESTRRELTLGEQREVAWIVAKAIATVGLLKVGKVGAAAPRAGAVGEEFLVARYGGRTQVRMMTTRGLRVLDSLAGEVARESKVGRAFLTASARAQVAKDAELLATGAVKAVEWHFFRGTTGLGPSAPLAAALEEAGIGVVLH